ncbi:MAG: TRAP transporter small permease subunit [Comamonas sp.]|nr:TRAP transporter small permease subunit [Comamonas sp.]
MQALLKLSQAIDGLSRWVGRYVIWLILAATAISGLNAVVRKVFHTSSNAFLEIQWYLFAASFLLAAGYALLEKEHVKVDVVNAHLPLRVRVWIDIFGFIFFLGPVCAVILYYGTPFFLQAWHSGETSSNAGGLIRWPVYLMMPLGFGLLLLQGISELIKRFAFLAGLVPDPTVKVLEKSAEEELAEAIRKAEEEQAAAKAKTA